MKKILKEIDKKNYKYIFICIILIVLQVWLDLKIPDYTANITRLITQEGTKIKDVLEQGLYMLLCAFGSLGFSFITVYFASLIGTSFARDIRKKIFDKIETFGMGDIKNFTTGSLITRTTNDVTQVQSLIAMGLQLAIRAPIMATWAIIKIVNKNFTWSLITGGAVLLLVIMIIIITIIALPKFKIIQSLTDNVNKVTRENLTGIRVIRAFNAENYAYHKFDNVNKKLQKTNLFAQRIMVLIWPFMSFLLPTLTLSIYYVGSHLINNASLIEKMPLFSDMVVFSSYSMQIIMSFMMLTVIFIMYPRASISFKRIKEVLNTKPAVKDNLRTKKEIKETGTIKFNSVSFKYPNAEECILENINLEVKKGEVVAFIGSTGSGKSTLLNLIPRFYDVTSGEILVDGVDVRDYKLEDLYNRIGYISQKAVLFSGSVLSNIKFGKAKEEIDQKEIDKSLMISEAKEFVTKMENGIESHIAQGGINVSGGQKQRLSIARAIARNPEIYLFDDTFSALDYKTDKKLRENLKKYTNNATTLIVAQRIGTIKNADRIIVLDEGKIVGNGTHEELLKTCNVYKEIALSQLSEEELLHE